MAEITVVEVGEDLSFVAANAGGDTIVSGIANANHVLDGVFLLVDNQDAASHTVTIDGVEHTVAAGELHALPANKGVYPGTELSVEYDAVTSVTVAAFRT